MWFFSRPKIETENTCNNYFWDIKTTPKTKTKKEKDCIFVYNVDRPDILCVCTLIDMGVLGFGADYHDIIRMDKPEHSIKNGLYIIMNADGSFKNNVKYKWLTYLEYDYLTEWKNKAKAEPDK